MARKRILNRRGSLHHNQFKGVKKELIEKQASQIIHTMTVGHTTRKQTFDGQMLFSHVTFTPFFYST